LEHGKFETFDADHGTAGWAARRFVSLKPPSFAARIRWVRLDWIQVILKIAA
jgi:hypothetical protein